MKRINVLLRLTIFVFFITSINSCCSNNDNDIDNCNEVLLKYKACLYGDSTFDPQYLYDGLKDVLGFDIIYIRCVPGCGYVNGPVNTVYYFVEKADTAYRLRYGDPVNDPSIDPKNLPEGCEEIDAHQYSDERINSIPENCDVVLIGGGINDIGSLSDNQIRKYLNKEDLPQTYDFKVLGDCVIATIRKIQLRCPKAKVLICGLSPSEGVLNGGEHGKRAKNADKCIMQCANLLGVPFLSLMDNLGWKSENILDYTDGVHPNTDEGRRQYLSTIYGFIEKNIKNTNK